MCTSDISGASDFPQVTVCVPAYNAGRTLARTLESLLAQDYPHLTILVSDAQSTDDTAMIVQAYAGRGVRYALGPVDDNWNHALSLPTSPLVAMYHADDLYAPSMVSRQVAFLQKHPEAGAVFTMLQRIDAANQPIRMGTTRLPAELRGQECFDFPTLFNAILKYTDFISTPTLLGWRETLNRVGRFDRQFVSAADLDFWLRMARLRPVGIIDEPLHLYRISAQQGSAQMEKARTFESHYFRVMDHYLSMPDVRALSDPNALAFYEMQRSIDQTRRAMTLLLQGQTTEARTLLNEARPWRHLVTATTRAYRFRQLALGTALWLGMRLGLGFVSGRIAHRLYQWEVHRRQQPVQQ